MQITTMPTTTTLFKTKWNTFKSKLSPHRQHREITRRRSSSSSEDNIYSYAAAMNNNNNTIHSNNTNKQKRRKHSSDAMSVGTFESSVSMKDKFRQAIPFFTTTTTTKRRCSSNISSPSAEDTPCTMTAASSTTNIVEPSFDFCKELEKLHSLYNLALDELNYAEDSQGSSYYQGDLETAREALDDVANAFILLLQHTSDTLTHEGLQSAMAPKLLKLQKRIDALPEVDEDGDLY